MKAFILYEDHKFREALGTGRCLELLDDHSTSTIEVRVRDGKLVVSAPNGGELTIAVKSHNAVEIGVAT